MSMVNKDRIEVLTWARFDCFHVVLEISLAESTEVLIVEHVLTDALIEENARPVNEFEALDRGKIQSTRQSL